MILSLEIAENNEIDIEFADKSLDIDIELAESNLEIDVEFSGGGMAKPPYEGEYKITPKVTEQVLDTKDKYMTDNVTVYQTPYKAVSNPQGGQTVTIGLE